MKRRTTKNNRQGSTLGKLAAGLAILWAFTACSADETDLTGDNTYASTKEINFRIDLPVGSPASKAIGESQENAITHMDVLAFKVEGGNETFDYTQPATLVSGSTWRVTAQVKEYPQRFVIVTGAKDEVATLTADPIANKNKATILAGLAISQSGRWKTTSATDFRPLPMWGESASQTITGSSSELGQVKMLRMLAGIDVELKGTALTTFEMTSVRLYNTNATGRVVPDAAKVTDGKATAPTIPSGATLTTGPIVYDKDKGDFSTGAIGEAMKGAIYTFETAAPADADRMKATCLVIGGKFNKVGNETFYRVDFFKADKQTFLDILRNHKYQVNITEVKGDGYSSPEEAFKSRSVNMEAEVLSWNEVGMNVITTDGQYTLAVDKDQYVFTKEAKAGKKSDNILNVWTDYTNDDTSKSGWTVEKYVNAANETQTVSWLQLIAAKGDANVTTETYISVDENNSGSERSAKIILAAGRLRKEIVVTQTTETAKPSSGITLYANDSPIASGKELIFYPKKSISSTDEQKLKILWEPNTEYLSITVDKLCSLLEGVPIDNVLNGGSLEYTILPKALEATSNNNSSLPQDEVSTVTFQTDGGQTATVKLRQKNFGLIYKGVKTKYASATEEQYSFTVNSNTSWKLEEIVDASEVLTATSKTVLNGKTGISGETTITFTVAAGKTGTATLRFINTGGLFGDVTVTLNVQPTAPKEFAGSNIVWIASDDLTTYPEGGYLTFATPENQNVDSRSQGVYFKWGSLVAISAVEANNILFSPDENATYPTYTYVPWLTDTSGKFGDAILDSDDFDGYGPQGYGFDESATLGDICRYISERGKGWVKGYWRLPTATEFKALIDSDNAGTWMANVGSINNGVAAHGTASTSSGREIGGYLFPTSGWRSYSDGALTHVGTEAYYMTGSTYSTWDTWNNRYQHVPAYTTIYSTGAMISENKYASRTAAYPVRCVRE